MGQALKPIYYYYLKQPQHKNYLSSLLYFMGQPKLRLITYKTMIFTSHKSMLIPYFFLIVDPALLQNYMHNCSVVLKDTEI